MVDWVYKEKCACCGAEEAHLDYRIYVDEVYYPNEFYEISFCSPGCLKRWIKDDSNRVRTVEMPVYTLNDVLGGKDG